MDSPGFITSLKATTEPTVAAGSPANAPRKRAFLPYLEGLRGLAALYVVFYHADLDLRRDRPTSAALLPLHGAYLHYGHFSVAVFIAISGYVLSLPLTQVYQFRNGAINFFKRRARRLLPAYYAALALSIPLAFYNDSVDDLAIDHGTRITQVITHALLIHDFSSDRRILYGLNGAHWTVAVEIHIYILFALVLLPVARRLGVGVMVLVAFAIGLAPMIWGIAHHQAGSFPLAASSFWFLGLFATGSAAALLSRKTSVLTLPWQWISPACGIGTLGFIGILKPRALLNQTVLGTADILLGLTMAATFLFVSRETTLDRTPLVVRFFASRPLIALGSFSYSLYLTHEPLLSAASHALSRTHLSDRIVLLVIYALIVPALIAFAFAFSLVLERPFVSSYRRRSDADALIER